MSPGKGSSKGFGPHLWAARATRRREQNLVGMGCSKLPARVLSLGSGEVSILPSLLLLLLCSPGQLCKSRPGLWALCLRSPCGPGSECACIPAAASESPGAGLRPSPRGRGSVLVSYRELGPLVFVLQIPISADGTGKRLG